MSILADKVAATLAACGEDITVADVGAGVHRVAVVVADVGLCAQFGVTAAYGGYPVLALYAVPDTTMDVGSTFTRDGLPYIAAGKYISQWGNLGVYALLVCRIVA